jgi:ribosomal protein L24
VLKDALMKGGAAIYAKGDKIQVNKGDFTGIKGQVVSIEDSHITFTAIGIP